MKVQTKWNLNLLYKNPNDPQIEKDVKLVEKLCTTFEKKYKGKNFTKDPRTLLKALKDKETMSEKIYAGKSLWYLHLRTDLDSSESKSFALSTKYGERITNASNKIKFFSLEIGKIPTKEQRKFLNYLGLKPYKYLLEQIFKNAKYNLSEGEEQLEDLLSDPGYSMWIETQDKLLSQQVILFKGKELPIPQAVAMIPSLKKKERKDIHDKINKILKSISHVAEGELNAIYNFKKIMDIRRGFKEPYSATILGYENEEQSIENLVSLVTKSFKISHRFYKLHAKLLGLKKLGLEDRAVKIGEVKTKFNFSRSVELLQNALGKVDREYLEIFNSFLKRGQIDVYPKKGKTSGAYCSGAGHDLPTYVLLNHVDNVNSLFTMAHEMGHAIHSEMSKTQPIRYQGYTISTAEVASTLFENFITEEVEKHLSDKEKLILLHSRILDDISTVFRQIACFNFELELHEAIRREGQVSKEGIAKLLVKHTRAYIGDVMDIVDDEGYFFVGWSHIRNFFYVYSYAYGQLISKALYGNYKNDPTYAKEIKKFLKAGGSMSPEDIFKSIGVDTSDLAFFRTGLKSIEKDIDKLAKLAHKVGRI